MRRLITAALRRQRPDARSTQTVIDLVAERYPHGLPWMPRDAHERWVGFPRGFVPRHQG